MKMYIDYMKEREGADVIATDKGFVAYKIDFPYCLIMDVFIKKEFRRTKHCYFLADQVFDICKQAGLEAVYCQTDDRAKGSDISKMAIEKYGFISVLNNGAVTTYKMELSKWVA